MPSKRSTPKPPPKAPASLHQLRFHYSLRILAPSKTALHSRTDVPGNATDLSLDYSFITDRLPNSIDRHPPLSTIAARMQKHLRWISHHCPHLRTFKFIIQTDECCAECNHAALEKEFGFVGYSNKSESKMSASQLRLSKLPVEDCFAVVVFKKGKAERVGDGKKGKGREDREWWKKHLVKQADEEGKKMLGNPYGHDQLSLTQLEAQPELEDCVTGHRWPVLMAWHHWVE